MTKRELIESIAHLPDETEVGIQLHSHRLRDGKPVKIQQLRYSDGVLLLEAHDQDQPIREPLKLLRKASHG